MSDSGPVTPPAPVAGGAPSSNAKLFGLIAWLVSFWSFIFLLMDDYKNDPFVRSHAVQAIAVGVIEIVTIPVGIGFLIMLYRIYLCIQAYNGKTVEVPVVYGLVKNFIDQV
jgi:uncharacterized membrane protein